MNSPAPPGKSEARFAPGPRGELIAVLPGAYHGSGLLQSKFIWQQWEREARRLFSLFWTTANDKHLKAFVRHIRAMRVHEGRRQS